MYEYDPGENYSIPIDGKLYKLLVNGSIDVALKYNNVSKYKCNTLKNSVLHIAAGAGQDELIKHILPSE